eukprot:GEMP01006794.1.p1 GENE.GEMP01006794.1~~GEMP01006794.1.p1  ORF type:complete len:993 (+),score=267.29 GEMP01006794.1:154-3132(+)
MGKKKSRATNCPAHAFFSSVLAQSDGSSAKFNIPLTFRDEKQYYATLRAFLVLEARAVAARALKEPSRAPSLPKHSLYGAVVNDDPLTLHIPPTCFLNRGTLVLVEPTMRTFTPPSALFFVDGSSTSSSNHLKLKLFGPVPHGWRFDKELFLSSLGPIHRREQIPAAEMQARRLNALVAHFGGAQMKITAVEDFCVFLRMHAVAWAKPSFDLAWQNKVCGGLATRSHILFSDSDDSTADTSATDAPTSLSTNIAMFEHRAAIRDAIDFPPKNATHLNASQRTAIERALQPGIHLLQGPPGSGKTQTATAIVRAYPKNALVVLTAASNQATHHLLTSVCGQCPSSHSTDWPRGREPLDRVVLVGVVEKMAEDNDVCRAVFVHTRLRMVQAAWEESAERGKRELTRLEHDVREQETWRKLGLNVDNVKARVDELAREETNGELAYVHQALVRNARVVVATLASLGRSIITDGLRERQVDVLILDEAAQALEAETLPCLSLKPKSWVLLGDPQQLTGSVIHSPEAKAGNYGRSLMERLMQVHGDRVLLDTQYRMHGAISSFVSRRYYGGELKNAEGLPGLPVPYAVIVHSGKEVFSGARVTNPEEARLIAELTRSSVFVHTAKVGPDAPVRDRPTILTFYQGQKNLLQKLTNCHVSTVDAFQGQEATSTIISWVRSSAGGFLEDFRRLNVALSRAKQRLLVVMHANQSTEGLAMLDDARQRGLIYTKEQYIAEASTDGAARVVSRKRRIQYGASETEQPATVECRTPTRAPIPESGTSTRKTNNGDKEAACAFAFRVPTVAPGLSSPCTRSPEPTAAPRVDSSPTPDDAHDNGSDECARARGPKSSRRDSRPSADRASGHKKGSKARDRLDEMASKKGGAQKRARGHGCGSDQRAGQRSRTTRLDAVSRKFTAQSDDEKTPVAHVTVPPLGGREEGGTGTPTERATVLQLGGGMNGATATPVGRKLGVATRFALNARGRLRVLARAKFAQTKTKA